MSRIPQFDVIIVGTGSGGALLINKLVNAGFKCLILNDGPDVPSPLARRSEATQQFIDEELRGDSNQFSEAERTGYLDGGGDPFTLGRNNQSMGITVGGSGHHNGMIMPWGTPEDYREWDHLLREDGVTDGELTGNTTWNGTTTVTGAGTAFTTELVVGDFIEVDTDADSVPDGIPFQVTAIATDTSLTISNPEGFPIPTAGGVKSFKNTPWNHINQYRNGYRQAENDIDYGVSRPLIHGSTGFMEIGRTGGPLRGDTRSALPRIEPVLEDAITALLNSTAHPLLPLAFEDDWNDWTEPNPGLSSTAGITKNPSNYVGFNSAGDPVGGGRQYKLGHRNKYDERRSGVFAIDAVRGDPNFTIIAGAKVSRILIEETGTGLRAVGVEWFETSDPFKESRQIAFADGVVLCAGGHQTPAILQRSGVGAPGRLQAAGVPVVLDLPGVGANFSQHPSLASAYRLNIELPLIMDPIRAYMGRVRSSVTRVGIGVGNPVTTFDDDYDTNILFVHGTGSDRSLATGDFFGTGLGAKQSRRDNLKNTFVAIAINYKPRSRGEGIFIKSENPFEAPILRQGVFAGGTDSGDAESMLEGVAMLDAALRDGTQPFASKIAIPFGFPSTIEEAHGSVGSAFHGVGSCALGPPLSVNPLSCLDLRARVRGIGGLRVSDNSIWPTSLRGNPHAPTQAHSAIIADMIIADGAV